MIAVLLMSVLAAISVGYLSAVAEVAVQKLHEVPVVRRTVEALFLFSSVDSVTQWAEGQHDVSFRRYWSWLLQWLGAASIVFTAAVIVALWIYFAALGVIIKVFLWFIVAVVLASLWFAFRR